MSLLRIVWAGWKKYRKRRRNFTVVLIGGYFLLFFFITLFSTINENLRTYWVKDFIGGDFIVNAESPSYDLFNPIPSEHYFTYGDFLHNEPQLKERVAPRLRVGVLLEGRTSGDSTTCILIGVDPEAERKLNDHLVVTEGRVFSPGTKKIILPEVVATNIGVGLGDEIIVYLMTEDGYLNYDLLTVEGYLGLSFAAAWFGQDIGFIPLDLARELLLTSKDTVSELLYVPSGGGLFSGLHRSHYRRVEGAAAFSIARALYLAYRFLAFALYIPVFAFILSVVYHNVVLLNAERVKEIGVYLTYGARPFWLRRLFLLELIFYTAYCAVFGGAFSHLMVKGINSLGFYPIDIATEVLMASDHFVMKTKPINFCLTFIILWGLVLVGSLRPIWEATATRRVIELFDKN